MSVAEAERRMAAALVAELLRAAVEDAVGDGSEPPDRPEWSPDPQDASSRRRPSAA